MSFGDRLMNLRKSKGMSQEELAAELDVTRQTVSKWESSQTVPDMNKLVEMASFFGISLDELVNSSEDLKSENTYRKSYAVNNRGKRSLTLIIIGAIIASVLLGIVLIKVIGNTLNPTIGIIEKIFDKATEEYDKTTEEIQARSDASKEEMAAEAQARADAFEKEQQEMQVHTDAFKEKQQQLEKEMKENSDAFKEEQQQFQEKMEKEREEAQARSDAFEEQYNAVKEQIDAAFQKNGQP